MIWRQRAGGARIGGLRRWRLARRAGVPYRYATPVVFAPTPVDESTYRDRVDHHTTGMA